MMKLKVDRIDGTLVICTDKEKKFFAIEKAEIPTEVKQGDFIEIDDNGTLTVSEGGKRKNNLFYKNKNGWLLNQK